MTGSLLEVLFTSTAISEAFKVITLGGVGIALLLTIFGVAKSSFDLDFENKRPEAMCSSSCLNLFWALS